MNALPAPAPTPASKWFYPERKRCLACRKYFGIIVIKRLWCSWECAGMQSPSSDPADWPREHRTGAGEAKATYLYPEKVNADQHNNGTIWLYLCGYCGMYHLGHKKATDLAQ